MGVLQIETRSEKLRNLGGVPALNINTGKAQAAQIVGNAKSGLWASRNKLGEGVQNLGKALCQAAISMEKFNRKTRLDDFTMKYESEMNTFMLGDGERDSGVFNEDFADGEEWMARVAAKRNEVESRLRRDLGITDRDWVEGARMIHGFDEQWSARMATRAFQVAEKRAQTAATGCRSEIEQTLAFGDGTPEMYGDWFTARTHEAIQHHAGIRQNAETEETEIYNQDIFDLFMRQGALNLVQKQFENKVKLTSAACADMEDRKAVETAFDEAAKGWRKEDGTYDFTEFVKDKSVATALGAEGLNGFDKAFEADWAKARRTAANNADAVFRQRKYQSHQDARDAEIQKMQEWETMAQSGAPATSEQKAEWYADLARRNSWKRNEDGTEVVEADSAQYPLGKYDKDAQAYYLKKADFWREAGKKEAKAAEKEESAAVKEARVRLETDLGNRLLFLKLDTLDVEDDYAMMSDEERAEFLKERQLLTDEVLLAAKQGGISMAKAKEFVNALDRHYTAEEKEAARSFLEFFGFDRESYPTLTSAAKAVATSSGNTPSPVGRSSRWYTFGIETDDFVKNEDCHKLYETFVTLMKRMPRGADKQEYTKKCLDEVSKRAAKMNVDAVIEAFNKDYERMAGESLRTSASNIREIEARRKGKKDKEDK